MMVEVWAFLLNGTSLVTNATRTVIALQTPSFAFNTKKIGTFESARDLILIVSYIADEDIY